MRNVFKEIVAVAPGGAALFVHPDGRLIVVMTGRAIDQEWMSDTRSLSTIPLSTSAGSAWLCRSMDQPRAATPQAPSWSSPPRISTEVSASGDTVTSPHPVPATNGNLPGRPAVISPVAGSRWNPV